MEVEDAGAAYHSTLEPMAVDKVRPTDPPIQQPTGEGPITSKRSRKRNARVEGVDTNQPVAPPSKRSQRGGKIDCPAAGSKQKGEELLLAQFKRIQSAVHKNNKNLLEISEEIRHTEDLTLETEKECRLNSDLLSKLGDRLLRITDRAMELTDKCRNLQKAVGESGSGISGLQVLGRK